MTPISAPQPVYLKDYTVPDYLAESIHLTFRIYEGTTEVTTKTQYKKNHSDNRPLILNGEHQKLISVRINGTHLKNSDYTLTDTHLTLTPPSDNFTLETVSSFNPAENTALEGLYQSRGTYCTQCEAEGFRRITYFQDRPDVMTVFTVRIEADKHTCPVLLSNGNLTEEGTLSDGRHYTIWHDPFPKPCYLFALVAGDLKFVQDEFTTMSGRAVDLRIYVRDGDQPQCGHAMESLKKSMKWDEEKYGREYQLSRFNIVAVSDFNMGAMENTSLNIFNTALVLAHPDTATDSDFYRVEGVIAHEYFHNWTGNRVTCRDWFQLSLKEGFTVFRDQEFSSDMNSRAVQRIDDVETLRSMQFPEDAGPLAHPIRPDSYIEINNFYTMTVYEKGAEIVRMQSTLLGAEKFRTATDLYFDRFDGQAVTCDDFVRCMEDGGKVDLTQFKLWYSTAGTPEITATSHYDEQKKSFTLTLKQHCPDTPEQSNKPPMYIPVAMGLVGGNGEDLIGTQILPLKDKTENFIFENIPSRPIPSILRNFSAPVRLTTDLSEDDLKFLMVHDTDGFNKWESAQTIYMRLINRMLDQLESGRHPAVDHSFINCIKNLLAQFDSPQCDLALLARMLSIPDYTVIAQERSVIHPEHIYGVLTLIRHTIFEECTKELEKIYMTLSVTIPYKPDADSMAQRSLKSVVLDYLTAKSDADAAKIAKKHYDLANNMTDRMMGMSSLMDTSSTERDIVLQDFYSRFKTFPLVIDKWFAAQARAVRPNTLADIEELAAHEDFVIQNPNRVRSLFATFAMRNPVIFHEKSGNGYDLFGNFISKLDPINPQISARLLTALRDWKKYDVHRQSKIREVLELIISRPNLSSNSYEIAKKTLES